MNFHFPSIRKAARGQDCTLNIVGACNYSLETVVLCHYPDESHGIGHKACDFSAGFACSACHDVVDRRVINQEFEVHREWYLRRSQTRTMLKLVELGVIKAGK